MAHQLGTTTGRADDFADTVDQIAAQLRDNPVLVTEVMGNGHTDEVRDALEAKAADAQFPVYVVLTVLPPGLAGPEEQEELATLLHDRIGGDGAYLVADLTGSTHLVGYGDLDPTVDNDDTLLSLMRYDAIDQVESAVARDCGPDCRVSPAGEAGILLDIAADGRLREDYGTPDAIDDALVAEYATDVWWEAQNFTYDDPEPMTLGLGSIIAVAVTIVVMAVTWRLLRALTSDAQRITRARQEQAEKTLLGKGNKDLQRVAAKLERAQQQDRIMAEQLTLARHSHDIAERLLLDDDSTELDLAGAHVLISIAEHALRGESGEPYRPCYFDPRHGPGEHREPVGGGLRVPVCATCRRRLRGGEPPQALLVRGRFRDEPYYEGDTVWARTGFGTLTDELWREVQDSRSGRSR